jgi:hypothetical protein
MDLSRESPARARHLSKIRRGSVKRCGSAAEPVRPHDVLLRLACGAVVRREYLDQRMSESAHEWRAGDGARPVLF